MCLFLGHLVDRLTFHGALNCQKLSELLTYCELVRTTQGLFDKWSIAGLLWPTLEEDWNGKLDCVNQALTTVAEAFFVNAEGAKTCDVSWRLARTGAKPIFHGDNPSPSVLICMMHITWSAYGEGNKKALKPPFTIPVPCAWLTRTIIYS